MYLQTLGAPSSIASNRAPTHTHYAMQTPCILEILFLHGTELYFQNIALYRLRNSTKSTKCHRKSCCGTRVILRVQDDYFYSHSDRLLCSQETVCQKTMKMDINKPTECTCVSRYVLIPQNILPELDTIRNSVRTEDSTVKQCCKSQQISFQYLFRMN